MCAVVRRSAQTGSAELCESKSLSSLCADLIIKLYFDMRWTTKRIWTSFGARPWANAQNGFQHFCITFVTTAEWDKSLKIGSTQSVLHNLLLPFITLGRFPSSVWLDAGHSIYGNSHSNCLSKLKKVTSFEEHMLLEKRLWRSVFSIYFTTHYFWYASSWKQAFERRFNISAVIWINVELVQYLHKNNFH